MITVTITLLCENAAFDADPVDEIRRILCTIPDKVMAQLARRPGCVCTSPESSDKLLDYNGNPCGTIRVSQGD